MGNEATSQNDARGSLTSHTLDEEIRLYLEIISLIDSSNVRFIPEYCDRVREET